jgi:tetratricopeptide (TPR) repeat protein
VTLWLVPALLAAQAGRPSEDAQARSARLDTLLEGTERALATVRSCQCQLASEPAAALPVVLRITEPAGSETERAQRLATLRSELSALLAELDSLEADLALAPPPPTPVITPAPEPARAELPRAPLATPAPSAVVAPPQAPLAPADPAYSADPLRHGIACFRAGRYLEACERLAGLDEARAHYWRARALERLGRLDEAIQAMERAVALDTEGFERRRAETDLALLRWKRDYAQRGLAPNLPGGRADDESPLSSRSRALGRVSPPFPPPGSARPH